MPREISKDTSNPAGRLRAKYNRLMEITDPEQLATEIEETIDGPGWSAKNRQRHATFMRRIGYNLTQLQMYVSNFILKADGDGVIS